MEKEFVPYTEALELKELGFDEPCLSFREKDNDELFTFHSDSYQKVTGFFCLENQINAPTFSQAFRWFREKYGLVIQYIPFELDNEEGQSILHHKHKISEYDSWRGGRRNTIETELCDGYEEAELACLKKLIEIIKNK